jgi:hypothetical protein
MVAICFLLQLLYHNYSEKAPGVQGIKKLNNSVLMLVIGFIA